MKNKISEEEQRQLFISLWHDHNVQLVCEVPVFCRSVDLVKYNQKERAVTAVEFKTDIDVVLYHNDDPGRCTDDNMISFLPEKRYADLFPNSKCRFCYEGFGEYFAEENKRGK